MAAAKKTAGAVRKPKPKRKAKKKPKLDPRHALFVHHYSMCGNASESARLAGYAEKSSRVTGSKLLKSPAIIDALKKISDERVKALHMSADEALTRLSNMARVNIFDIVTYEKGGAIKLKSLDEIPEEKRQCVKSIRFNKRTGDFTVELISAKEALDPIIRHHGLLDRCRQAQRQQDSFVRDILKKVRENEISPIAAALMLEEEGLNIPEALRLILMKTDPEPVDPTAGEYAVLTPEEMAARASRRAGNIEKQRTDFVPQRQAEVVKIKEELGHKNTSFEPAEGGNHGKKDA